MLMRAVGVLCLGILLVASGATGEEYLRDEIRVKLRAAPGADKNTIKILSSGAVLNRIGEEEGWVRVRTRDGVEGWVPTGYLTETPPASVTLPSVAAALKEAESKLQGLDQKLSMQAAAIQELETLRQRNGILEEENLKLAWSSTWKYLLAGALIFLGGMLLGGMLPRGSAQKSRRIQL